jgi:hypothetical protein
MIDVHNLYDVTAQDHPATWQIKHERSWVSGVDIVPICLSEAMWAWLNVNAVGVRGWPLHTSYLAVHYFFGLQEFFGGVARRKASWRWFDNSDIILIKRRRFWLQAADCNNSVAIHDIWPEGNQIIFSYFGTIFAGGAIVSDVTFDCVQVLASKSTVSIRLTDINLCRRPQ